MDEAELDEMSFDDLGLDEDIPVKENVRVKGTAPAIETKNEADFDFQHKSDMELATANIELFNSIKSKLAKMYPEITVDHVQKLTDQYGEEVLGKAIGAAVAYSENAAIDTLPHEYAHIYINLLEQTTFVKNTIKMIAKSKGLSTYEAKEYLASEMGKQ